MIGPGITKISNSGQLSAPATLQVDVIADLACPWSYLGKRRLDSALSSVHGPSIVTWYPYQVNPDMPAAGMAFEEYLATKFGDPTTLEPALEELTDAGKSEGIDFRFDLITHVPSTLDAHRLMNLAESQSADTSYLADLILKAFFSAGQDISDREVLIEIAAQAGLGHNEVLTTLKDDRSKNIVLSQEAQVRQSGVVGVPDFLVNKRLFVVGAQRTENLVNVFDRAMFGAESDLPTSETLH
ncbi:MAG: DsbA family oxidoreductase [Woeseiaceae bacterium]